MERRVADIVEASCNSIVRGLGLGHGCWKLEGSGGGRPEEDHRFNTFSVLKVHMILFIGSQ